MRPLWPRNRRVPDGIGRFRGKSNHCATSGLSSTAFRTIGILVHASRRRDRPGGEHVLRAGRLDERLVRRKGRVYVINKVQRRFKARQG